MKPEERIGETHGIYTIVGVDREAKGDTRIYQCKCNVCGWTSFLSLFETKRASKCTHTNKDGEYKSFNFCWNSKRMGAIFRGMLQRCYNENEKSYRWYGAKGIKVFTEWINNPSLFEKWALENGYNDSPTIDRIDENKDYCPENCRWISGKDNAKYKSTTRLIEVNGKSHTGREWSKILNIGTNRINTYVRIYGIDDTAEFIKRFLENPELKNKAELNESLFDLYMS